MNKGIDFLKKLGGYVATGAAAYAQFNPELKFLLGFLPQKISSAIMPIEAKITNELTLVSQQVVQAEAMGAALTDKNITGPDKAKSIAANVTAILANAEFMAGMEVEDAELAKQIAQRIAGDVADWLKNVKPKHVPEG